MSGRRSIPQLTPRNVRNFWRKIKKGSPDECWNWQGAWMGHGYGVIRFSRQNFAAHRIAFYIATGQDPDNQCVCHRCDNPACCNPQHLFLGTHQDNMVDRNQKGRSAGPKGEANASAKITADVVQQIRQAVNVGGMKYRDAAKKFGVYFSTIGKICRYQIWKHVA